VFFSGTMDCGKSTLALQMDYNHRAGGPGGVGFSRHDRAGGSRISDRLGLPGEAGHAPVVGYETLCRRHFMRRVTAHGARMMAQEEQLLPFEVEACRWRGSGDRRRS
jgi:hypothetical protein